MNNAELAVQMVNLAIITRYEELDKQKRFLMNKKEENYAYVYQYIREEILKVYNDPQYVTDVLVEYLYNFKKSSHKTTLWESFGDVIVKNLERNLAGTDLCEDCGVRFEVTKQRQKKCPECAEITKKEKARLRKVKFNNNSKKN
ncbi:hypothetical protein [Neobacillus cucumis]|uniref:hypothetical protein n=1 Tax=Neobacillus cucumis TaxID=1740721 RepID=UPI002E1F9843|nr:hypothetical protein [Neobacillus cucumis]